MADVSGTVRDAHRLMGTGGNAPWGNDDVQWLVSDSSLVVAVVITCLKTLLENIAFNLPDLTRMKPKDRTLKTMDRLDY